MINYLIFWLILFLHFLLWFLNIHTDALSLVVLAVSIVVVVGILGNLWDGLFLEDLAKRGIGYGDVVGFAEFVQFLAVLVLGL